MIGIIFGGVGLYARRGAYAAAANFLITFVSVLAAINYYPLLEWLIVKIARPAALYAGGAALLISFIVVFLLLQYLAIRFFEANIQLNAIVNGIAGAIFGAMASAMLAGLLVIGWFMLPGSLYYKSRENKEPYVTAAVDEKVLTVVRFMANDRIRGSQAFDPSHTFMRDRTTKFMAVPEGIEEPERFTQRRSGGTGRPNFNRQRILEDDR